MTRSEAGMTLIEVLVVLAIIAVAAGLSVLAIGAGSGTSGRAEAARLASRLQLAADRSMIEDTRLAFAPAKDGYSFIEWDARQGSWRPSRIDGLGERVRLPAGMTITPDDARPLFPLDANAGGLGFTLTLADRSRHWAIAFDGITARLQPGHTPATRSAP
ncbi:MAG: prepilin-type N-terminal cleavage/methylation domain-containing protein [Novosphingobium sp.]